jgi:hypothetical protein
MKQDEANAAPAPMGPVDLVLGLAPERAGQPRMMTIIDGAQEDETGHWYSPAAVREMLTAERERWQAHADAMAQTLEAFEAQGSDKTAALRAYRAFRA